MSLLNSSLTRLVEPGIYDTTIRFYKEVTPKQRPHEDFIRQPYILVEMLINNVIVTDRWYASRIPYLMHCLRHQFRKDYFDCTLSQLLDYAKHHVIRVEVSYDPRYGQQISYDTI